MYGNNYYNPRYPYPNYGQQPQVNNQQMPTQPYIPPIQPIQVNNLQGKIVDSIEVVKSTDIPLDGSVSYFALADGSAIVTKQLQNDGTSKMVVYKPIEDEKKEIPKYVTFDELQKEIKKIDLSDLEDVKDDVKEIKSN